MTRGVVREGSRLAQWRRVRARRVLAALLTAAGVIAGLTALSPPPEPTARVVVAGRDLPAGHLVRVQDVTVERWPVRLARIGTDRPSAVTGRTLVGPVTRGEPVTAARLLRPSSLPRVPGAAVVVAVPTDDAALVRMLRQGDRVDVLDASGRVAALRAVVVATAPPDEGLAGSRAGAPTVLLAVSRTSAAAIAQARSGGVGGTSTLVLALSPSS